MAVKTLRAALDVAGELLENEQFKIDPKDFFTDDGRDTALLPAERMGTGRGDRHGNH